MSELKTFQCDCGFEWLEGQSGSHSCSNGYKDQIAALTAQNEQLQARVDELEARNALCIDAMKEASDLIADNISGEYEFDNFSAQYLDTVISGNEGMLLQEIKAQAIDEFVSSIVDYKGECRPIDFAFSALNAGEDEFSLYSNIYAAQLRANAKGEG